MLKIRLRRMGNRHRPFYRVVVSNGRKVPASSAIEEIGTYDPRQSPSLINIDTDRVDHWVGKGAQLSETVAKLVKKARLQADAPEAVQAKAEKAEPVAEPEPAEVEAEAEEAEAEAQAADSADGASADAAPEAEAPAEPEAEASTEATPA